MKPFSVFAAAALFAGAALQMTPAHGNSLEIVNIDPAMAGAEIKGEVPARAAAPFFGPRGLSAAPMIPLGQGYAAEIEPNNTTARATPLAGTNVVARGSVFPDADLDYYSFSANAGDRVYAAVTTQHSASGSTDSQLRIFAPDGTTLIEFDEDDGSMGALSSTIAGAVLPSAGTYFLQVKHFSATNTLRPYDLHFRLQAGAPIAEVEPNDTPATATPLPGSGWVSGARNPALASEQDWYSFSVNAGDTVFLSLDLDPERDNVQWNGRLGIGLFGDANNQILVVDDGSAGTVANPLSEAMFITIKTAGTYYAFVDSATAATGGPTATYHLSVSIHPAANEGVSCTTYSSTNVPQAIGPGAGLTSSTITIPGNPRIADLDVSIQLDHGLMGDLDVNLRSPSGNDNGLFNDIGASVTGGQMLMDITLDDEAGSAFTYTTLRPLVLKPELNYRLDWFDGEDAGGIWTLDIRDDTTNASGGTLTAWSMRVCEAPPPPSCAPGSVATTVHSENFSLNDGGYTHSGTADEWEYGTPATLATTTTNPVAAFSGCNTGTGCWKTDLDNTYDASSNQDLVSVPINLGGFTPPVVVRWAQRYQIESATFDRASVQMREIATPANTVRLWDWTGATMTVGVGSPTVNIGESAGWGEYNARGDAMAGLNSELVFHVDSESTINFGGLAVDDVTVTACRVLSADLSITKTDGVTTATPGGSVTYTITASNAGPDPVVGATVADTFPASMSCNWTCIGAGGGTCTAAGAGNINDSVDLPAGGSTSHTAACTISAAATGTLSNTATVASGSTDPVPGNNSATDADTLTPSADLAITKTDGVASVAPGGSLTYTITASNAGPSNAPGSTVADTFPASLTCTWTCVGAGGGTCTAAGAGNINDGVNLPAGGSTTFTASCTVSGAASGSIANTATVAAVAGVTDPTPGNNSATDTDTVVLSADLSISKTDGVATVSTGGTLTYTIVASNTGPQTATGATVTDTFPAACTSVNWTCATAGGATCTAAGSGNINDVINLPASATATYTATCPINALSGAVINNTASIAVGGGQTDPVPGNNTATDNTTVTGNADVTGTKTVAGSVVPGGAIVYSIVLTNGGSAATGDNAGDEFVDVLPAGLTLVSATATTGTVIASVGTNTVTWNGALAASATVTITINALINPSAVGNIVNQGTINFDADGNGSNETARLTDDPALGGGSDPTGFTVLGIATAVPTTSFWALMVLTTLLLGFGLRRRFS